MQEPVSFTGTLLDVKKTYVTVVVDAKKSLELTSFIESELAFVGFSYSYVTAWVEHYVIF